MQNLDQKKDIGFRYDLEMLLLSTKILLKLTVYGFNKPYQCPEVMNFMASIFERIKTILELSKYFKFNFNYIIFHGLTWTCVISGLALGNADERCMVLTEKIALTMVKILSSVLESHPFSYADFVQITFQCCFFYCFTPEGHVLIFETMLIRWLNLLKAILLCQEYKLTDSSDHDGKSKQTK